MSPDPFVFTQYRDRDPDREQVETLALGMRTSHTSFGQASVLCVYMACLLRERITTTFKVVQAKEFQGQNSTALSQIWNSKGFMLGLAKNIRLKGIFEADAL